ncbi:MAG: hypothetical protein COV34_01870 [Candidatus Zambryskibacteria bacterium CG10_big_fil_rev_8_21_14_0_10_42_12]|uniref:D-alanine--D-alanine ligase n=1 Tax=Candidatus Zambryskibacteria bacterium CG10_big_fil_rev_8_21_14_0_10_42_12 TaxID=1975115 RepID=A0A2H0QVN3_9BACT|nr:MAG: hypothetical protein COV34_01870 [Candidatus Zambryskibacteria bacterium CG10_big_fil_rev_8_21_14_0_10_42_12]
MSKLTVGVLRGGPSHEYEVSLNTGRTVLQHMPDTYRPVDIFISKDGEWHIDGIVRKPMDALRGVDVAFNALHGEYGEDGQVQRLLEDIGIPFTGSDAIGAALSMHKAQAKEMFKKAGIKVPSHRIVQREEPRNNLVREVFETMFLPLMIKPVAAGSSVGMTILFNYHDIPKALDDAFEFSDSVLIEHFIRGREATCSIVEDFRNSRHYALLPIEIVCHPHKKFLDYEAKYDTGADSFCPGNFSYEEKQRIEQAAILAHDVLGLRHYSRSDFILTPKGEVYILETNSLPGLTDHSFLPKSLTAVGSNMPEFLDHVIHLAVR